MVRLKGRINDFSRFWTDEEDDIKLDINTKKFILKASSSVVSLKSYSGDKELFKCSGFIVDCDIGCGNFVGTIWTSATLLRCSTGASVVADDLKIGVYMAGGTFWEGEVLAFDFHYNIAVIRINSDSYLPTSTIRLIDDSVSLDSRLYTCFEHSTLSQFCGHYDSGTSSNRFSLYPGEEVFALARYFDDAYDVMVAPGEFSLSGCSFDCKELRYASCKITKIGIGGPLINRFGEVIGINFYNHEYTPFLPINLASKCFADLKKHSRIPRPWIGLDVLDLYAESFDQLEKLHIKFPHIVKGAVVQEVIQDSPAFAAGLLTGDVIVNFDGNSVGSCLELAEALWDKEGESVKLVVVRASSDEPLNFIVEAVQTNPQEYEWPIPDPRKWLLHPWVGLRPVRGERPCSYLLQL